MRQRIISFACLLSLLLCLATVGLWARSFRHGDSVSFGLDGNRGEFVAYEGVFVSSDRGSVHFGWTHYPEGEEATKLVAKGCHFDRQSVDWRNPHVIDSEAPEERWRFDSYWRKWGFGYWQQTQMGETRRAVVLPHLLVVTLLAAISAGSIHKRRRRASAVRRGKCLACAYDLTGNTSGTCPECGSPIPIEAHGVEPWPEWRKVEMAEPDVIDPGLSFTKIRRLDAKAGG